MNIIHICCASDKPNGIKTVLKKISVKQRENGNEVRVLSLQSGEPSFKYIHSLKGFIDEIQSSRPDLVIFHSVYYVYYALFSVLLSLWRIPYAVELHGALSKSNYRVSYIKKMIANFLFFKRFLRSARGIIYLNKNEYENSIVKDINPNYIIIPNGCDISEYICTRNKAKDEQLQILYIGRIERVHKGLDILLDAMKIISNNEVMRNVRFVFCGDGSELECKWFLAQISKLSKIAEFRGPIYGEQKEMTMLESDIFILTSRFEGMPMGVLEALSMGLPCILTKETNLGVEVQEAYAGWLTSLSSDDIARDILRAIEDYRTNHMTLSQNALTLSRNYSWDTIAKTSIQAYMTLLSN